ncbi:hypothetical protein ACF0H5_005405 [Mactra antiquata]
MNTTSRFLHHKFGKKKDLSPFASLLLELSLALTEDEVSKLKLAISVDKVWNSKRQISSLKYSADVLNHLHDIAFISSTDTVFLEQLLVKIHRKDLEKKIRQYHEKEQRKVESLRNDETAVKIYEKEECRNNVTEFTALKELKHTTVSNRELRSCGDGCSGTVAKKMNKCEVDHFECSPMVVDENSQEKLSQMSISDDEKYSFLKTSSFEDDIMCSQ